MSVWNLVQPDWLLGLGPGMHSCHSSSVQRMLCCFVLLNYINKTDVTWQQFGTHTWKPVLYDFSFINVSLYFSVPPPLSCLSVPGLCHPNQWEWASAAVLSLRVKGLQNCELQHSISLPASGACSSSSCTGRPLLVHWPEATPDLSLNLWQYNYVWIITLPGHSKNSGRVVADLESSVREHSGHPSHSDKTWGQCSFPTLVEFNNSQGLIWGSLSRIILYEGI